MNAAPAVAPEPEPVPIAVPVAVAVAATPAPAAPASVAAPVTQTPPSASRMDQSQAVVTPAVPIVSLNSSSELKAESVSAPVMTGGSGGGSDQSAAAVVAPVGGSDADSLSAGDMDALASIIAATEGGETGGEAGGEFSGGASGGAGGADFEDAKTKELLASMPPERMEVLKAAYRQYRSFIARRGRYVTACPTARPSAPPPFAAAFPRTVQRWH